MIYDRKQIVGFSSNDLVQGGAQFRTPGLLASQQLKGKEEIPPDLELN